MVAEREEKLPHLRHRSTMRAHQGPGRTCCASTLARTHSYIGRFHSATILSELALSGEGGRRVGATGRHKSVRGSIDESIRR